MPQTGDQDPTVYHKPAPTPSPTETKPKHIYNGTSYEDRSAAERARDSDRVAGRLPKDASISVDMGKAVSENLTSNAAEVESRKAAGHGLTKSESETALRSALDRRVAPAESPRPSPSPRKSLGEIADEEKARRKALALATRK